MARNVERDELEMKKRKQRIMEVGLALFSEEGIEKVSLQRISVLAGIGPATMYNYYQNKTNLVVAISAWTWFNIWDEYIQRKSVEEIKNATAYVFLECYLDEIIRIYKERPNVLRFSSDYKTYICRQDINEDIVRDHLSALKPLSDLFHEKYEAAKDDKSIRTDIDEQEVFTNISINMLGMAERYAQGIVWFKKSDRDYSDELLYLKGMLLDWVKG